MAVAEEIQETPSLPRNEPFHQYDTICVSRIWGNAILAAIFSLAVEVILIPLPITYSGPDGIAQLLLGQLSE